MSNLNSARLRDADETIIDNLYVHSSEEKIEALTDLIYRAGDDHSADCSFYWRYSKTLPPKLLANTANTLPSPAAAS